MSHSSTESEITSLDAGLRMDGIPALDLWDVVKEVLHSSSNKKSSTQGAAGHCSPNSNTRRAVYDFGLDYVGTRAMYHSQ